MKKKRNVIINKSGGTAGKNSVGYKVSLPVEIIRKLGISENDREIIFEWDDENEFIKIYREDSDNEKIS